MVQEDMVLPSPSQELMVDMVEKTISSTSMSQHLTHSSGDTEEETQTITERSISHRKTTHSKPRWLTTTNDISEVIQIFQLKWHDGYEGHGEHYFDYNHVGPKHEPEPYHAPAPAYAPPKPAYAGPAIN